MRVAVLDDYQRAVPQLDCFSRMAEHDVTVFDAPATDEDALAERLQPFEAIVLLRARTRMPASLLARLPRLRLLVQTGNIGKHVDVAACARQGITVCAKEGPVTAAAELTWALILASCRHLETELRRNRAGQWQGSLGRTVSGKRIGLVGFGRIGRLVARYATAFGATVTVWGRDSTRARAQGSGLGATDDLHQLFAGSDIVSMHLKLTDATQHIVRLDHLRAMQPDALFVNTSRAQLVRPGALEQALREGRPGYAAVDVYEDEPLWSATHPLLSMPQVLPTPHIGFVERDTYETYLGDAFDAVNAFAAGSPINTIP